MVLWLRILVGVYVALGVLSLLLVPANAHGWFGMQPDPLSGILAAAFAMPWTLVFVQLPGLLDTFGLTLAALGIALNALIGVALVRWAERRRARRGA